MICIKLLFLLVFYHFQSQYQPASHLKLLLLLFIYHSYNLFYTLFSLPFNLFPFFFFFNSVILFFQSPAQCSHWVHLYLFPSSSCIIRTSTIILKFIKIVHINGIVVMCMSVFLSIGCTS